MGMGQMPDGVLGGAESLTNGKLKDVVSQVQAVIQGKAMRKQRLKLKRLRRLRQMISSLLGKIGKLLEG
jgi:hypothetical protein